RLMRTTGCLAGAGLLLALSTVPAGAQQQQPQQPPPPGCFTVEMSHSTQGNPQGSQRRDCLAGVGGLELRNVLSKYPFERSHRFPARRVGALTRFRALPDLCPGIVSARLGG